MSKRVKNPRVPGQTRISSKHQVTIPAEAFRDAGLREGDVVRMNAMGQGRVELVRLDELLDEFSGCLDTGGEMRAFIEELRNEWR